MGRRHVKDYRMIYNNRSVSLITNRLRDRGFDNIICFDDCSKHFKLYRQISLILVKILSRDVFLSDISNIHVSIS